VVDVNPSGGALLSSTLARKFPGSRIRETSDINEAARLLANEQFDAAVVHRALESTGIEGVRHLRKVDPDVPLIMLSSADRRAEAIAAGASSFLPYDAWLMLGSVVADLLPVASSQNPWPS
jgi:DNA-binding NarL/FixJ family response regulator